MSKKSTRAFSLIEAAIVLGIIGLVLGGIWVAASSVSRKMKQQRTIDGIYQVMEFIRTKVPRATQTADISKTELANFIRLTMKPPAGWDFNTTGASLGTPLSSATYGGTLEIFEDTIYAGSETIALRIDLEPAACHALTAALQATIDRAGGASYQANKNSAIWRYEVSNGIADDAGTITCSNYSNPMVFIDMVR